MPRHDHVPNADPRPDAHEQAITRLQGGHHRLAADDDRAQAGEAHRAATGAHRVDRLPPTGGTEGPR